ncbi:hydroxysteroid 11-beta-dehydrogenase 1-like protein B [Amphiura filiformis]|uniref:hydroxysteroid 11-beta-dehydrogenase 1-like protein B n=1 Tax=Amphiura filiformis TaxID=82378 RepID=UPI003B224025
MAKIKLIIVLLAVFRPEYNWPLVYFEAFVKLHQLQSFTLLPLSFRADEVRGKRVIITGASSGIGEQLAYQYSQLGAKVLITARREHVLQQVVAKCKALGAQDAYYIPLDMGKLDDTKRLIEEAKTKLGGIDHLILNHVASTSYYKLWTGDMEQLQNFIDVNFRSYVSVATYATPMLNESNGSMAVVSSVAGKVALPLLSAYSASKFALDGFFSALRQEFVMQNMDISVTLCIIGSINTTTAVEYSKHVLRSEMFYTSASDTANRIMKGATLREREVYFPWIMTRPPLMVRDFVPNVLETLTKSTYKEGALENLA